MIQNNTVTIFFYIIIVALILLIFYFNIIAGIRYSQGMIIDVKSNTQCKYPSLSQLNEDNKCSDGTYYYQSPSELYYTLGKNPVLYLNVCKSLCGGSTDINGQCGDKNPAHFAQCLADLQPQTGCKNSAVPLVEYINKIYYYAQKVTTNKCN